MVAENCPQNSGTLLIVEDDDALAATVATVLEREGFAVTVSHDGKEGLRIATAGVFDAVVTDFRLPGLGGMELLEQLHQVKPRMPVVMMTSLQRDQIFLEKNPFKSMA